MEKEPMNVVKFKAVLMGMPALDHNPERGIVGTFDVMKSEVCGWLVGQQAALEFLCERAMRTGMIVYDEASRKWLGIDTERGAEVLRGKEAAKDEMRVKVGLATGKAERAGILAPEAAVHEWGWGRPSKVKAVMAMDLSEFLDGCDAEGEGLREICRRLRRWLKRLNFEIAGGTTRRCVAALVESGRLTKNEAGLYLRAEPAAAIGPNATGAEVCVPENPGPMPAIRSPVAANPATQSEGEK
jgi:hypothetical protein